MRRSLTVCVYANAAIAVALSLYLFLIPAAELVWDLRDPGLHGGQVPRFAFRWHRQDPKRYVPLPQLQVLLWWILLGCATVVGVAFSGWIALVFLLAVLILPWQQNRPVDKAKQTPCLK